MSKIAYLLEKDLGNYVGLSEVTSLNTVSDVATLIEVFEETVKEVSYKRIKSVVKDSENYFYLVVSEGESSFDFFTFVNETFNSDIILSSINVRYLFPKRLSRGVYEGGVINNEDDDDIATSFLDEDDLGFSDSREYEIYHVRAGVTVKVDKKGLIIGRSPKKVDYLIKDNTSIGRVHCNVYVNDEGKLVVHDFDSTNGTFVNNKRVHSSNDELLFEGDILSLSNEEFRVI